MEICKRKRKQVKGKLETFQTQSELSYLYSVDLPFCFELYQKSLCLENPCHATNRRRRIFLFVFINRTMRDAGNGRQTVCKRRKNGRRKRQLQRFGFAQTSWKNFGKDCGHSIRIRDLSEAQQRDESKRQTMFMSIVMGAQLAKIPIPNRLYQVFDQVGKSFLSYKPGKKLVH